MKLVLLLGLYGFTSVIAKQVRKLSKMMAMYDAILANMLKKVLNLIPLK